MGVYFAFVLGVGFTLRRHMKTSTDYFLPGRSIPAWVARLGACVLAGALLLNLLFW
jgi:SSS family solute:Na+ symporter